MYPDPIRGEINIKRYLSKTQIHTFLVPKQVLIRVRVRIFVCTYIVVPCCYSFSCFRVSFTFHLYDFKILLQRSKCVFNFVMMFHPCWQMWIKSFQNYSTLVETIDLQYNIHTFPISRLILNTPILQSIKTLDSWSFQVTRICTLEFNVRKPKTKLQFIS